MYELIILTLLIRIAPDRSMSGYIIAKIINDIIGPIAKISNGRLYPLLTKLEGDGLIEAVGMPGERRQRAFRITETGSMRFHQLMLDTTSNPGEYQTLFWYKVPFLGFLKAEERFYLIDHYINYCQTHIFHLRSEMEDLKRMVATNHYMTQDRLDADLETFHHYLNRWQLELDDTRGLRTRVQAAAEYGTTPSAALPSTSADDTTATSKKKG